MERAGVFFPSRCSVRLSRLDLGVCELGQLPETEPRNTCVRVFLFVLGFFAFYYETLQASKRGETRRTTPRVSLIQLK